MPPEYGRFARLLPAVLLAAFLFWLAAAPGASAQETLRGVALVVGNGKYTHLERLANPPQDADAIEALLDDLGFDSVRRTDRDAEDLERDLERFVEDAEGADVAILYYAGHGIEAGGDNWLVPVDADTSSLERAAERLIPVSNVLARLRGTVPVAIVLLDACRDSPFPAGATLVVDDGGEPLPVSAGGRALPSRGAGPTLTILEGSVGDVDNLGIVIGFSAGPGQVAEDGKPGENSPYAAALVRHVAAMAGQEFGTVMRMVAEEVYLKTEGRQRPWVNESLRRLLYFGETPEPVAGPEGEILEERRGLLLTIAALPEFSREQVERVAAQGDVPMDALYGLLRALGPDVPKDPVELDKLLKAQTGRLKQILSERAALESTDPEITRLSKLADKALAEGALDANVRLREAAKARFEVNSKTLDKAEAELKARRLEGGEIFARAADAHMLKAHYLVAASNYEKAFQQVRHWDRQKAWKYKFSEAYALLIHGDRKGDNKALNRSIAAYTSALSLSPRIERQGDWAATQNDLGNALQTLGKRESDTARLERAVTAYRAALKETTRERVPLDWAATQNNLGSALQSLSERESNTPRLKEAITAYRAALEEFTRERAPLDWAMVQNNLGTALHELGTRESSTTRLEEAVTAYRAALEERTRERVPLDWAGTQMNLGSALASLGEHEGGTARLEEAVAAYRAALEEWTRERVPLNWATTQNNLGAALRTLGERENSTARLEEAVTAYRAALEERTRKRTPFDWAATQYNLGSALRILGERENSTARLEEAVAAYRAALEERTRQRVPLIWAKTQNNLGIALQALGERRRDTARLEEAVAAFSAALEVQTRDRTPLDWATTQYNLGIVLGTLGASEDRTARLEQAVAAFRATLEEWTRESEPLGWARTQNNLGIALQALGERGSGIARLKEAVAAYRAALEEFTRERTPLDRARTETNLGGALVALGKRSGRRVDVEKGRQAIISSWELYRAAGHAQYDGYFEKRLAEIDALVAAME